MDLISTVSMEKNIIGIYIEHISLLVINADQFDADCKFYVKSQYIYTYIHIHIYILYKQNQIVKGQSNNQSIRNMSTLHTLDFHNTQTQNNKRIHKHVKGNQCKQVEFRS